jgi:hypothetical protein
MTSIAAKLTALVRSAITLIGSSACGERASMTKKLTSSTTPRRIGPYTRVSDHSWGRPVSRSVCAFRLNP